VKKAVKVPVFANGNVLFYQDALELLAATGCDAVMSAEGVLYNAALFVPPSIPLSPGDPFVLDQKQHPWCTTLTLEYIEIVKALKTPTTLSAVKGHIFKLCRPALMVHTDLRTRIGKENRVHTWEASVRELHARLEVDAKEALVRVGGRIEELVRIDEATGIRVLPHWLTQPYFRAVVERSPFAKSVNPAPSEDEAVKAADGSSEVEQEEVKRREDGEPMVVVAG
jgi:tRNA-dihydrouridine synthase 1